MNRRQRQKAETREGILDSAVRILKKEGLADASVAAVMAEAGLTVGGFYAHFASKDALAGEAVRRALTQRRAAFLARPDNDGWRHRIGTALAEYFARAHRDDPTGGCPLSRSAIDTVRTGKTTAAFAEELDRFAAAFVSGRCADSASWAPREAALGTLALMVGGMILARATKGTKLSDEILAASAAYGDAALEQLASKPARPGKFPAGKRKERKS